MMNPQNESEEKEHRKTKEENAKELVRRLHDQHKGQWLTEEACEEYQRLARGLPEYGGNDIGERRRLREELQDEYGLLEIEAINILNGNHVKDYLRKYYMIKNLLTVYDVSKREDQKKDGGNE